MATTREWAPGDWREGIYEALKSLAVRHVAYVPDAGHTSLIEACIGDPDMVAYVLTTEEEGMGVIAGADLGGERGVMLMQSSGVGNCQNAFTLMQNCGFPFLALVTMRGEWEEFNPWQVPMGRSAADLFALAGIEVARLEDAAAARATVEAVGRKVFESETAAAILLAQKLIGAKVF